MKKSLVDTAPKIYYNNLKNVESALDAKNKVTNQVVNSQMQNMHKTRNNSNNRMTQLMNLIIGKPKIMSPIPEK